MKRKCRGLAVSGREPAPTMGVLNGKERFFHPKKGGERGNVLSLGGLSDEILPLNPPLFHGWRDNEESRCRRPRRLGYIRPAETSRRENEWRLIIIPLRVLSFALEARLLGRGLCGKRENTPFSSSRTRPWRRREKRAANKCRPSATRGGGERRSPPRATGTRVGAPTAKAKGAFSKTSPQMKTVTRTLFPPPSFHS